MRSEFFTIFFLSFLAIFSLFLGAGLLAYAHHQIDNQQHNIDEEKNGTTLSNVKIGFNNVTGPIAAAMLVNVSLDTFQKMTKDVNGEKIFTGIKAGKDLLKLFVGPYAILLDIAFNIVFGWGGKTPTNEISAELKAINRLAEQMQKNFNDLNEKIDRLEHVVESIVAQYAYIQEVTTSIDELTEPFVLMFDAADPKTMEILHKQFIEKCRKFAQGLDIMNRITNFVGACFENKNGERIFIKPWPLMDENERKMAPEIEGISGNDTLKTKCLPRLVYLHYHQKRANLEAVIKAIRLDALELFPIALTCIGLDEQENNETRDIKRKRLIAKADNILDILADWGLEALNKSWPSVFVEHATEIYNKAELPDANKDLEFKYALDKLAREIRDESNQLGLPEKAYHVEIYSPETTTYPNDFDPGAKHIKRSNLFVFNDSNYQIFYPNDKIGIAIVPVHLMDGGVDVQAYRDVRRALKHDFLDPIFSDEPSFDLHQLERQIEEVRLGAAERVEVDAERRKQIFNVVRAVLVVSEQWREMGNSGPADRPMNNAPPLIGIAPVNATAPYNLTNVPSEDNNEDWNAAYKEFRRCMYKCDRVYEGRWNMCYSVAFFF